MKRPDYFEYFAPGRVNLIGEHIDYNGGKVLPFAVDKGTYLSVRKNGSNYHIFATDNFEPSEVRVEENNITYCKEALWPNYVLGIIAEFEKRGTHIPGCDFFFSGNLPTGAGLSSSASVELVTAYALNDIMQTNYSLVDLSLFGKSCENNFVKLNCGIMDQLAVALSKKDKAVLLDCNTYAHEYVNFSLKDHSVVVINTNKPRNLIESAYNERFSQCMQVLNTIKKVKDIQTLCDLTTEEIEEYKTLINDDTLYKRLRHVVGENERVHQTVCALNKNDLLTVGTLLTKSHESLKNDYEVTGIELDTIVETAIETEGVIGARMTGAGFGGCAIAIVENDKIEEFKNKIYQRYNMVTKLTPDFYIVSSEDGVRKNIVKK